MARIGRCALAVMLAMGSGCVSMTHADVTGYARELGFEVTADELPPNSRPLAALAYDKVGYYFFGLAPIISVDLRSGVERIVAEARDLGAHGLAHLRYEYRPASAFRFVVFPLPDWTASLSITGMAYVKTPPAPPDANRPGFGPDFGPDAAAPPTKGR